MIEKRTYSLATNGPGDELPSSQFESSQLESGPCPRDLYLHVQREHRHILVELRQRENVRKLTQTYSLRKIIVVCTGMYAGVWIKVINIRSRRARTPAQNRHLHNSRALYVFSLGAYFELEVAVKATLSSIEGKLPKQLGKARGSSKKEGPIHKWQAVLSRARYSQKDKLCMRHNCM